MILVFLLVFASVSGMQMPVVHGAASDLFISEYIEGSGNNKALEIYNGTGGDINLSDYSIELYSNGASSANTKVTLSGTLGNDDVYIIANSSAVAAVKDKADLINGVANFNGDDAVVLKKNGAIIDSIGQVGFDPGTAWESGDISTLNHTLVRVSSVTEGDADPNDEFDPSDEWEGYAQDTFDYLGYHDMEGSGGGPDPTKTENVTAEPEPGEVEEGTEVFLSSATDDAVVYYAVYYSSDAPDYPDVHYEVFDENNPIVVNEPLTIKTYAAKDGMEDSDISEFGYSLKQEAQEVTIAEAKELALGAKVVVQGKVTTVPGSFGTKSFYIQDNTAGMLVFTSSLNETPAIGNTVRIEGATAEYNGKFEIIPDEIEITDNGTTSPAAKAVSLSDISEENEGLLVKVKAAEVTKITSDNYKSAYITVSDGMNGAAIKLDNRTGQTSDDVTVQIGDFVDVTGVVEQSKASPAEYMVMIRSLNDIAVSGSGDTEAPVIVHTAVIGGNINSNLIISAEVTDNRHVANVKLYYRTKGTSEYVNIDMSAEGNTYSAVIPKAQLSVNGIEYYIEAVDGVNTSTVPADITSPYEVPISDADIIGPEKTKISPANNAVLPDTEVRPTISAEFADLSGIDSSSIKLIVDGTDVTVKAVIQENSVSYQPSQDMALGEHAIIVEVKDKLGNKSEYAWTFTIGEIEYNHYYGQLHSHTGEISDGQGTLDQAYTWARDEGEADFFAVTDHSNWFDNDKANEDITDVSQSTSSKWKLMNSKADQYNKDGEFVAIAGYEMTWSGSTGGWGHMNTFNTPWFASRSNSSMDLPAYYKKLAEDTDSLSQFNHPGTTFGDFADFGYYSQAVDNVVNLIEVGNGEGPVRGSGYFPSYEYYTRALDKGWHLAPSNNQDNHKAGWITANDARTVVLSEELTRDSIYEAIRSMRVYSTEDKNLEITYKVNGNIMGSLLDSPEKLEVHVNVKDPDIDDAIGKVSIISNGGVEVASETFEDNEALWELELDPQYSYYYVRVDQEDKDIAVTAPVWTDEVVPVGISKLEISQDPQIVNNPIDISATVYNNGLSVLENVKVEFYKDSIDAGNKIGEDVINYIEVGADEKATIEWTADTVGKYNLYARTTISIEGVDRVFSASTTAVFANLEDVTKVVLDRAHYNAYISGDYAGKDLTLREMFKERKYMLVENNDELTAADLENAKLLIVTDPQSTDKSDTLKKSVFTDAEVAVIKGYMDNGGSLIICSKADYKDGTGEYSNGAQLNKILEAVGTNLRVNDDEVVDEVSNGGQIFRLYFDRYISTKYGLTDNIPDGTTYSFYSGCSVILKDGGDEAAVDWLVKGHETTGTIDSDTHGDHIPVPQGNVNAIGAELLNGGGKIIVAGTIFFSDFETESGDDAYSNKQITANILDWLIQPDEVELKTISEVRADENKDGIPDHMGKRFAVEGRVTAQSEAVVPKNAFFEVIYVQDETGGITVFGVSATPLPLGTKVRIMGTVDQYDGDAELSVGNETKDVVVLSDEIVLVEPMVMSTGDSMLERNEGWLVAVEGTVTRMTENSLYLDDGSGEARVYVNGYINDGTDNEDMRGKWDPAIKVGDKVRAIGLASEDPEGHRLRVRNTAEIVRISSAVTGITLDITEAVIPVSGSVTLKATVQPEDAANKNVLWSSSDESIATVTDGVVKGLRKGSAVITAATEDGGYTASCNVKVEGDFVPVKGVILDKPSIKIKTGNSMALSAEVQPEGATNKKVLWSSSNTNVATVENGLVTGINEGTAVIIAAAEDGSHAAACNVKVESSIVHVKGVAVDKTSAKLKVGKSMKLKAYVYPEDATNKNVEWISSNPAVATVENGLMTGISEGTVVIIAATEDGGYAAACNVKVEGSSVLVRGVALDRSADMVKVGRSVTLKAAIYPKDATNKNVLWSSSNTKVATVDNGVVTGKAAGMALITVTTEQGGYTAYCLIIVTKR